MDWFVWIQDGIHFTKMGQKQKASRTGLNLGRMDQTWIQKEIDPNWIKRLFGIKILGLESMDSQKVFESEIDESKLKWSEMGYCESENSWSFVKTTKGKWVELDTSETTTW